MGVQKLQNPLRFAIAVGFSATGFLAFSSFMGEIKALQTASTNFSPATLATLSPLPGGASANYYTIIADKALAVRPANLALAEEATLAILQKNNHDVTSWNRLAYLDLAANRQLTREGLAALYKSYEISPYGDLQVMAWRVEFASNHWSSLPTDLKQKTLAQIPVIGKFGISWEWRIKNCKYNPVVEVYQAVCAIAPDVIRPKAG